MLRDSTFGGGFDRCRDKAKLRWFSKSKSICAGWSGKVPRYCAIWTPKCGGMKGKLWTFLRNAPSFLFFLPAFFEKTPVPSPTMSRPVSSSAPPYARTDTPLRIAHSASSQFLPSPFTLHLHPQFIDTVCFAREGNALFLPSPVKEIRVKPSPASRCFIVSYSRVVKR